jgi:ABC-type transport system involved in cytochrome c biogenesis permease subunit
VIAPPVVLVLTGVALALYAACSAAAGEGWRRRAGALAAAVAVALHGAAILLWWRIVGHGPYLAPFEVLSADAWLLAAGYVAAVRRVRRGPALDRLVYGAVAALVAAALALGPQATPLPLVMRSTWLVLHVVAYHLAFVALVLGTAIGVVSARGAPAAAGRPLPPVLSYRYTGGAFALWTAGMLLGSLWAFETRGEFWAWEAVEIWAAVAWGVLGMVLHVHRFYEPGPRAQAWLHAGSLAVACVALFVAPLLGTAIHGAYLSG